MKKLFLLLSFICLSAFAEASFQQIESLIEQKQYRAAEQGLIEIIKNHPQSAKAYYAMSQAQAGLGNQEKAQFALDKARGLDPDLKFASTGNVQNLQQAIVPNTAKIEPVHEHDYAWLKWALIFGVLGLVWWYHVGKTRREKEAKQKEEAIAEGRALREKFAADFKRELEEKAAAKKEQTKPVSTPAPAAAPAAPSYVQSTPSYAPAPTQTVIHHHSSGSSDLVNAILINDMLSHHHHDTTRVVEREVIREVPAPSRDSSWDTPAPSRSSSWDDSSSSKSSSWDTPSSSSSSWSSSSSSSSSWDSGSSSSDSSSSWD
jgi:hypothetical protein